MHIIRLRKPWSIADHHGTTIESVDIPESKDLSVADSREARDYFRKFNATQPLLTSRVGLRLGGWSGRLVGITVNQHKLVVTSVSSGGVVAGLTGLLTEYNEIKISLVSDGEVRPRLTGEVVLEVCDQDE